MARRWRLFSNHGLVLAYILRHPDATLRQMAFAIGLTERAVYQIVADLEQAGMLVKQRQGRRNVYMVDRERLLAHDLLPDLALSHFLQDVLGQGTPGQDGGDGADTPSDGEADAGASA
ncbi:MAG TPA: helix-turn-helix domain-containing protein [Dehalococcoidia bacterium]|nr:helix-turn-helix domain-containing protein [Dehalococcoidia bacterium]